MNELQTIVYIGIGIGAAYGGFKAQGITKNGRRPLTYEDHASICKGNLLELKDELKDHFSDGLEKVYEAINELRK